MNTGTKIALGIGTMAALWYIPLAYAWYKITFGFSSLKILHISEDYIDLQLNIELNNNSSFRLNVDNLKCDISINGILIGNAVIKNVPVAAKKSVVMPIYTRLKIKDTGNSLWSVLVSGDLVGTAITLNGSAVVSSRPVPINTTMTVGEMLYSDNSNLTGIASVSDFETSPGSRLEVQRKQRDAVEFLINSQKPATINFDVSKTTSGEYVISNSLKEFEPLEWQQNDNIIINKRDLRRALRFSKKKEGTLLSKQFYEFSDVDIADDNLKLLLDKNFVDTINAQVPNFQTARFITLYQVAFSGLKFRWLSKKQGAVTFLKGLGSWYNFSPAERKLHLGIISERTGVYPEKLAEELAGYDGDSHETLNGVEDALLSINSVQGAKEELKKYLLAAQEKADPDFDIDFETPQVDYNYRQPPAQEIEYNEAEMPF